VLPDATLYVPAAHAVQHVGDPVALPPKPVLQVQSVIEEVCASECEAVGQHMHWYLVVVLHPRNEYVPAPHELRVAESPEQFVLELAQMVPLLQVCDVDPCTNRRTSRVLNPPWASAPGACYDMPSESRNVGIISRNVGKNGGNDSPTTSDWQTICHGHRRKWSKVSFLRHFCARLEHASTVWNDVWLP
jgi:hypothetical protein